MKFKGVGLILILLLVSPETLVTHRIGFNSDFLVPGNIRITNDLSDIRNADYIERQFSSFMRKWDIKGSSDRKSVV